MESSQNWKQVRVPILDSLDVGTRRPEGPVGPSDLQQSPGSARLDWQVKSLPLSIPNPVVFD